MHRIQGIPEHVETLVENKQVNLEILSHVDLVSLAALSLARYGWGHQLVSTMYSMISRGFVSTNGAEQSIFRDQQKDFRRGRCMDFVSH